MKEKVTKIIESAVKKLGYKPVVFSVDYPPSKNLGDYSCNVALQIARQTKEDPFLIARQFTAAIFEMPEYVWFARVEAVRPGFINLTLSDKSLHAELASILSKEDKYGRQRQGKGQKVLVEYFQPNIAKPLHIGHIRTAVIGDALLRILKSLGYKVESDTHMGDWGTQFGLLLYAYKLWGNDQEIQKDPINVLNRYYVRVNKEVEKDPAIRELGKQEFLKLEQGHAENRRLWKKIVNWSMKKFLKINSLLDITPFDHHWPESFYEDKLDDVLVGLKKKKLLQLSEGAQIVDLKAYNLGTGLIVKSDGATTYLLRDLATYLYRKNKKKFTRQLYVIDSRQAHTFAQLFKILELLGEWSRGSGTHVQYGFMSLPEGAISTRKGHIIELEELVAEATDKARRIIAEKNPDLKKPDKVARKVAIGALKYFDLSHNRHSNIVFQWEKALNFEGNSGPYLQYTYARIKSILRKSGLKSFKARKFVFKHPQEQILLRSLCKYSETVAQTGENLLTNQLTEYLYHLASEFNSFYQKIRVLDEPDEGLKRSRLALASAVAIILKNGLGLLGITVPEEM